MARSRQRCSRRCSFAARTRTNTKDGSVGVGPYTSRTPPRRSRDEGHRVIESPVALLRITVRYRFDRVHGTSAPLLSSASSARGSGSGAVWRGGAVAGLRARSSAWWRCRRGLGRPLGVAVPPRVTPGRCTGRETTPAKPAPCSVLGANFQYFCVSNETSCEPDPFLSPQNFPSWARSRNDPNALHSRANSTFHTIE